MGEITGDYYNVGSRAKQVWRVSEDGEIRDTFRKLRYVFEMEEQIFLEHYVKDNHDSDSYLEICKKQLNELVNKIPELPFSNIWIASKIAYRIPDDSVIHFGILNSLRSWNLFEIPYSVLSASNVGGFGIDGGVSTLVGASLTNKNKLYFGIFGDLAFFYDMNALGNRHIGNNLRIMIINNGKGAEFRLSFHAASQFGENTDKYVAAGGHYGNQSPNLVKNYAQNLGFMYISSYSKQEFEQVYEYFLKTEITEQPILFEVFTNSSEESDAWEKIMNIEKNGKGRVKQLAKQILSDNTIRALKKIVK
jgi:2-succinyl-5-enolpyruvyl-6-hydroxy-3-cyclohexene-1-carboxylate synthase